MSSSNVYKHEVASCGQFTAMFHYREQTKPSGLIVVQEIGHTVAIKPQAEGTISAATLIMPDVFDLEMATSSRIEESSDQIRFSEQIDCNNLDEFVSKGLKRWELLVSKLGSVSGMAVHLAERRKPVEEHTTHGLILSLENPGYEFQGYVATPDEIQALERLAYSVPLVTDTGAIGSNLYL